MKSALLIFVVSIAVFFFLRLVNLTQIPVFVDEAIYIRWSQVMRAESTLRFLPLSDGKQPLFMWLTIPALKFFQDPLFAGRLVSVASGFGSLVLVGILTFLLTQNLVVGAIASLVYALLPFAVFFDRMALVDSLLGFFGLGSLVCSYLFARYRRLDIALITGFFIGGGLLTKSPAVFYYLWLFWALVFIEPAKKKSRSLPTLVLLLFTIVAVSQAIYSVLRLGPGFGLINSRNQDYVFGLAEVMTHPLNPFVGNFKTTILWFWYLFTPGLLIPLLVGGRSATRRIFLWLLLATLSPLAAQAAIAKVYTSRYIFYAVLPTLPLISIGLMKLPKKAWLLLSFPLFLSFMYVFAPTKAPMTFDMHSGYLEEWTAGWGQKEIAAYLVEQSRNQPVVVFTEGYFGTLPDGLVIYTEGHPNITIVGSPPEVFNLPEGLVNSAPTNLNYFVLNRSRNHLDENAKKSLKLLQSFSKSQRADGTQETLDFYQYFGSK